MESRARVSIRCALLAGVTLAALAWALLFPPASALAQGPPPTSAPEPIATITTQAGAPVIVDGQTLFTVKERVGSFTPAERAAAISSRITDLATNPFRADVGITVVDSGGATDVMAGDQVLMTVTDQDAADNGTSRQALADARAAAIRQAVAQLRAEYSARAQAIGVMEAVLATVVLIVALWIVNRGYAFLVRRTDDWFGQARQAEHIRRLEFYRTGRLRGIIVWALKWGRVLIWIWLITLYVPLVLGFFPATRYLSNQLGHLVTEPLASAWQAFLEYLPNLFVLLIILGVTYVLWRIAGLFFKEIEAGSINIPGFESDWAGQTYKLISLLLILAALIVGYTYLPGANTDIFKGVTVFVGILFTLSSTTAVGNLVAGVIATYTGAYHIGDVVAIGGVTGRVIEKRLLTTVIRTFKNEDVSIPNGQTLSGAIINYSNMARREGLILHTTITIGYDAPWQLVHSLLIDAAKSTPGIVETPAPFVLQTALKDYNVAYELNAYTQQPEIMPRLYAALHAAIQDKFNAAGVEIMSPTYTSLRDGNTVTIPPDQRPAGYQAPTFGVSLRRHSPAENGAADAANEPALGAASRPE
ncbi:MAG: mechanosensitive ion channel [Anaerolineae bacterium]